MLNFHCVDQRCLLDSNQMACDYLNEPIDGRRGSLIGDYQWLFLVPLTGGR